MCGNQKGSLRFCVSLESEQSKTACKPLVQRPDPQDALREHWPRSKGHLSQFVMILDPNSMSWMNGLSYFYFLYLLIVVTPLLTTSQVTSMEHFRCSVCGCCSLMMRSGRVAVITLTDKMEHIRTLPLMRRWARVAW